MDAQKRKTVVITSLTGASTIILWGPYALDAFSGSWVGGFSGVLLSYGVSAVFPFALLSLLAMRRWQATLLVSIPIATIHMIYLCFAFKWVSLIWFHEWPK